MANIRKLFVMFMLICVLSFLCILYGFFNTGLIRLAKDLDSSMQLQYVVIAQDVNINTPINLTTLEANLNCSVPCTTGFTENATTELVISNVTTQATKLNVSVPCTKGFIQRAIKVLVKSFDPDTPIFLTSDYKEWGDFKRLMSDTEPFGIKNNVEVVDRILQLLPLANKTGATGYRGDSVCKRCILVASSGVSIGMNLGKYIDQYDVVIRMNDAPVNKYQKHIGSKTSFRLIYPESAFRSKNQYNEESVVVLTPYKLNDYLWLEAVIKGKNPNETGLKFWKKSATSLDKPADKIQILNPYLSYEVAKYHIKTKRRPSTGAIALMMALHYCDHLDISGYGLKPNVSMHYYEKATPSTAHNWDDEKLYILKLLHCGVIESDLTGLYTVEAKVNGSRLFNCMKL